MKLISQALSLLPHLHPIGTNTPKPAPLPVSPQLSNNQWLPIVHQLCSNPWGTTGDFLYPGSACPYPPVSQLCGPPIVLQVCPIYPASITVVSSFPACFLTVTLSIYHVPNTADGCQGCSWGTYPGGSNWEASRPLPTKVRMEE